MHRIMTYGTLKQGQPNHYLAVQPPGVAKYIGKGVTVDKWPLITAGIYNIPFLLDKKGIGNHVIGEIYEVDDEKLSVFDRLEHHPECYTRLKTSIRQVTDSAGTKVASDPENIWIYFIQNPRDDLLYKPMVDDYDCYTEFGKGYVTTKVRDPNGPTLLELVQKLQKKT